MGRTATRQQRISELLNWTTKQQEAFDATFTHRFVLYGGARGGGKSRFLRWWLLSYVIYHAMHDRSNVHVGLFCNTYPELRDRQISKIAEEFPQWLGQVRDSKESGLAYYVKPEYGGGVIALRNLDDPEKYRSAEFAAIGDDEVTLHDKQTFDYLRGSLRWPGIERPVYVGATNPGGLGHMWVKQLWIDRDFPPEMRDLSSEFMFVRSLPADNPYLSQTYWSDLHSLPPDLSRAWVEGDWNVFAGQAFSNWRHDRHVIKPFDIPAAWTRWRAVDWGYSNPWCCLWLARNPDNGRIIVYREAYQTNLTDRQQAHVILDSTPPNERITVTYADPSMWASKSSGEVVTSTADIYQTAGVPLTRADNDRLSGKRKVDRLLEPLPDGLPGVQIFENCTNLIRTLPALAYDKTRVEDVDTHQEDHCLIAGTMVATENGDVPIERIAIGSKVLTRMGYCSVTRAWLTQHNAQVYEVQFSDGKVLIGTAGHPVYVDGKGYVSIDTLRYGDTIYHKENNQWQTLSSSTASSLGDTRTVRVSLIKDTIRPVETTGRVGLVTCIKRFGKAFMEASLPDTTFTTGMGTISTTTYLTLNVCQLSTIFRNTNARFIQTLHTWRASVRLPLRGTDQRKGEPGTNSTPVTLNKRSNWCAPDVENITQAECIKRTTIVRTHVGLLRVGILAWMTLKKYALSVEKLLRPTSMESKLPARAYAVRVIAVQKLTKKQDVYNLEVENEHEFFANGVLVHNCYDSLRYGLSQAREYTPKKQAQQPPPIMALKGLVY